MGWFTQAKVRSGRLIAGADAGQALVHFVILLPVLLILVGMIVDGGFMFWQYRRVEVTLCAAAQAASHTVDVTHFRATQRIRLDRAAAFDVANDYVRRNAQGTMAITAMDILPNYVSLRARAQVGTIFLRAAGIKSFDMGAECHAYPAYGINWEFE